MFLLINKPKVLTSHDVVDRVRRITGERRVGHGGTLDPNATGRLIVGVGRESTKKLDKFSKGVKTYEAEIVLGEERDTDDAEGNILEFKSRRLGTDVEQEEVENVLKSFLGEQEQVPPIFSAIKIGGKKSYDLARRGKKVELKKRKITVYSIKLVYYKYPVLKITAEVSGGTYIRSIARDVGQKLLTGAFLNNLKRTKIGSLELKNAVDLDTLDVDNWKEFAIKS
jgi:tRNA pseudouridine55 synthase